MNPLDAQDELASILKLFASSVDCYFWRLSGDEGNCLSRFLGIAWEDLKSSLVLCGVFHGENDRFSVDNFESLLKTRGGFDFSHCKHKSHPKGDYCTELGNGTVMSKPKDMCVDDGKLDIHPEEKNIPNVKRTERQSLVKLTQSASKNKPTTKKPKQDKKDKDVPPREELYSFVRELMAGAIKSKSPAMPRHQKRRLKKIVNGIVDCDLKNFMQSVIHGMEQMGDLSDKGKAVTPDRLASDATVATPATCADANATCSAVTDLTDEMEEEDVPSASPDDFLKELQEEIVLQSPPHKRTQENKEERAFQLEHENGKKSMVVLPPNTKTAASFEDEAGEWADNVLDSDEKVEGILGHLAKKNPKLCASVAKKKKVPLKSMDIATPQAMALARVGNLNIARFNDMKSFLRTNGVTVRHSKKKAEEIDATVGLDRTLDKATTASVVHEWSSTKGKEKKAPETVEHWNSDLSNEIEAEVDIHPRHLFAINETLERMPSIGCEAPGFEGKGVTALVGGDHGDKHCPIGCKLNFTSPQVRKEKNVLNCQCPMVQFASASCSKDAHDPMEATVMPTVRKQVQQLEHGATVTIYHSKNARNACRSHVAERTIQPGAIAFRLTQEKVVMTHACGDSNNPSFGSVDDLSHFEGVPWCELKGEVATEGFNQLFIGDLAFLCMLTGVNGSDGAHCPMCELKGSEFNCEKKDVKKRTPQSLEEHLVKCKEKAQKSRAKKPPPNFKGVNCEGPLSIDPQRTIAPILHCPMGPVDKILDALKEWTNLDVEELGSQEGDTIRNLCRLAKEKHEAAIKLHNDAKTTKESDPTNAEAAQLEQQADKARIKAKKEMAKPKERHDDFMQRHNATKKSLVQQFEMVCRSLGITREHCHGGKFNGVNCIGIVGGAEALSIGGDEEGFLAKCLRQKNTRITEAEVKSKPEECAKPLTTLDTMWSLVRGIDGGLLPTKEQERDLEKATAAGKALWLKMGIGTKQPKWHLTFDGHLVEQHTMFGGLADKADDSIEKFHQVLKELRTRFRTMSSYEKREKCVRRELRRKKSPDTQKETDKCQAKAKQSAGTKRRKQAKESLASIKRVKKEKREAAIA